MSAPASTSKAIEIRKLEPRSQNWRNFAWRTGAFDSGQRPHTEKVDGVMRSPHHMVLVTIDGGAEHIEVASACGHRYSGRDWRGAVSFVPAHCERRLQLWRVRARWASITLRPELLDDAASDGSRTSPAIEVPTFTNVDDPFIASLVAEMSRLYTEDDLLEATYCDAMSSALAHYLARRYGRTAGAIDRRSWKLAPWQLRRIADHVEAHIDGELRVADLALLVGVSSGHLHRAFRATTGVTPLAFINERRIRHAMHILARGNVPVAELALRVGFASPSHFARTFRRLTGSNPSAFRGDRARAPGRS